MQKLVFDGVEKISLHEVKNFENQFNINLPKDYREFLTQQNGGYLLNEYFFAFEYFGELSEGIIHCFLGVYNDPTNIGLAENIEIYRNRMPPNIIPVAFDPGGNCICLSIDGQDRGVVYFWDHDLEYEEYEVPGYKNLFFIAQSFSEFLSQLSTKPEMPWVIV